ncbi:hypothetical protein T440DRAFT_39735 [Plenodomus tracheiphilus IPT5]|uniref:Uncharacterized protein n=1 Tax=Plenodomus tracheiphilus IPT5 TaxID=1408161 RepID=A0A6A7BDR5_9PLEO|nr:hypothetical protein T440DRAFT_39735 [Plenodomus tracheiphilus IPT5]
MSCPLLESFRALPARLLLTLAGGVISSDDVNQITEERGVREHNLLAERVYYLIGDNLLAQGDVNSMTRLQMEHSLREKDWLDEGEEQAMTEWKVRIRLLTRTRFAEIQAREQAGGMHTQDSASEDGSPVSGRCGSSDSTVC